MITKDKKKVLFVEEGMGFGGSAVSLYDIVNNLELYKPLIVFHAPKHTDFLSIFRQFQFSIEDYQ